MGPIFSLCKQLYSIIGRLHFPGMSRRRALFSPWFLFSDKKCGDFPPFEMDGLNERAQSRDRVQSLFGGRFLIYKAKGGRKGKKEEEEGEDEKMKYFPKVF